MAGPRSPTSPVTAQLILQRRKIISFWCCADFQQRSNEWMFVLPQTRSCSFHGDEKFFRLDDIKRFKNIRSYGWVVLPLTGPSSFHGVEESTCMDVLQPFKNIQVYGWAALPNIPCHGPAHFAALKNHFVLMLCRLSTTFKWTAARASQNTVERISRCWNSFSFWCHEAFQKHWNLIFHSVEEPFGLDVMQPDKNIQESFRFDNVQTFNNVQMNGCLCSPKHSPAHFTVLKTLFDWMVHSFSKRFELMAGPCSPKHGPLFYGVEQATCMDVLQACKKNQVYGWAALPNIPCHGPAHFAALKNHFVLMLCRHATTFKWTDGRAPPNTVLLIPPC